MVLAFVAGLSDVFHAERLLSVAAFAGWDIHWRKTGRAHVQAYAFPAAICRRRLYAVSRGLRHSEAQDMAMVAIHATYERN